MNGKKQLLCTFSNIQNFKNTIGQIYEFYNVYNHCVFIFYNVKNIKEVFLTYSILNDVLEFPKFPNTISVHRKKQTNTLYTLNAMNQIICDENNGEFDNKFQINWDLYKDSLIIIADVYLKIIPIKIYDVLK